MFRTGGSAFSGFACLRRSSRLLVISPDHRVSLADGASFVAGLREYRIGDVGPHALAFRTISFLCMAFGVFGVPRHSLPFLATLYCLTRF
jgi:hypothetical protein